MAVFSAIATAIGTAASTLTGTGAVAGAAGAAGTAAGAAGTAATSIGGLGGIVSAASGAIGTGMQIVGQSKANKAAEKAEKLREAQMNIEASRAKRQTVREAIIARAQSMNSAEAQGAGGSSGALGGASGIVSQAGQNVTGINQNQQISSGIFQANREIAKGQSLASMGSGLRGFGSWFADNRQTLTRTW